MPAERNTASRASTCDMPTSFAMAMTCCNAAGKSHQPAPFQTHLTPLPFVLRAQEFLLAQHNVALGLLSRSHCQELLLAGKVDEVQQHLELTLRSTQLLGKHSNCSIGFLLWHASHLGPIQLFKRSLRCDWGCASALRYAVWLSFIWQGLVMLRSACCLQEENFTK